MASARRHGNERSMDESRKENQKRIDEKCQNGTIAEAVNCFQEKLPDSLIHVYKTMTPHASGPGHNAQIECRMVHAVPT